jgi:hypothetical protein
MQSFCLLEHCLEIPGIISKTMKEPYRWQSELQERSRDMKLYSSIITRKKELPRGSMSLNAHAVGAKDSAEYRRRVAVRLDRHLQCVLSNQSMREYLM